MEILFMWRQGSIVSELISSAMMSPLQISLFYWVRMFIRHAYLQAKARLRCFKPPRTSILLVKILLVLRKTKTLRRINWWSTNRHSTLLSNKSQSWARGIDNRQMIQDSYRMGALRATSRQTARYRVTFRIKARWLLSIATLSQLSSTKVRQRWIARRT